MTRLTEAGARSTGWRIFSGRTQSGKPLDDVLCPVCSDRGAEPDPVSWNVRCTKCGWDYLATYGGEEPDIPVINARDALTVLRDHQPEVGCVVMDISNLQVQLPGEWNWRPIAEIIIELAEAITGESQ